MWFNQEGEILPCTTNPYFEYANKVRRPFFTQWYCSLPGLKMCERLLAGAHLRNTMGKACFSCTLRWCSDRLFEVKRKPRWRA